MEFWCGYTPRNGVSEVNGGKKYLFNLQGVDFNDDTAIEEFAREVWERFIKENGEEINDEK